MDFGKKLSLLMSVLSVSNSALAKALSVDPSLISRWRSGSRIPAKDSGYIEMIASYLVEHAKMEHQKLAICEITGCVPEALEKEELKELVKRWLLDAPIPDTRAIGGFLNKVGLFRIPQAQMQFPTMTLEGQTLNFEVFFGKEGKQRAAMKFLLHAMNSKEPSTVLLYSDESVDWFLADREYALRLGATMIELTKRGWKINMVHTLSRDISEMLRAIEFWLPLYMTGSVTPYYNPKYREHYFRRTLFVVPKLVALTCAAFEDFPQTVNLLTTEPHVVELFEQEYQQFLNTCRPLMRIPQVGSQEMFSLLEDFEDQPATCLVISDGLPLVTMPSEVLERILERNALKHSEQILSHWRKRTASFEKNLKQHPHIHIVALPDVEQVRAGKASVELAESGCSLFYTVDEYVDHLKYLLSLLKKYENYQLCISPRSMSANVHTAVKDQIGVLVFKKDPPVRLFAMNHPDMTNAFYCYAEDFLNRLPLQSKNKERVIETIELMIRQLENH